MPARVWLIERYITGAILILGALLFVVAAFMPLTDPNGKFIYSLPPQQWLQAVSAHLLLWQWTNWVFISGTVVTMMGLALFTRLLQGSGGGMLASLGLFTFAFGAVLWVIILAFRLGVDPWVAQEAARTDMVPGVYEPLILWTHALVMISTVMAFLALALFGGSGLISRLMPSWVGWFTFLYSLAGLGIFIVVHDIPPVLQYLPPLMMGATLLLRRSTERASAGERGAPS